MVLKAFNVSTAEQMDLSLQGCTAPHPGGKQCGQYDFLPDISRKEEKSLPLIALTVS